MKWNIINNCFDMKKIMKSASFCDEHVFKWDKMKQELNLHSILSIFFLVVHLPWCSSLMQPIGSFLFHSWFDILMFLLIRRCFHTSLFWYRHHISLLSCVLFSAYNCIPFQRIIVGRRILNLSFPIVMTWHLEIHMIFPILIMKQLFTFHRWNLQQHNRFFT